MLSIAVLFASNRNGRRKKEEEEERRITDTLISAKTKISLKALLRRGLVLKFTSTVLLQCHVDLVG